MRTFTLLCLAIFSTACQSDKQTNEYSGVVEIREIQAGSRVGGRVTEVLAAEGKSVAANAPMVRFDSAELQATRDQLIARIGQAQADLDRLRNGYRPEEVRQAEANAQRERAGLDALQTGPRNQEIEGAEADYKAAQAEAANATRNTQRIQQLHASGDISAQSRDDAKARSDAATERAASAAQRVALLRAGTRSEDIRAGQARYDQATANVQLLKRGYRKEEIAAATAKVQEAKAHLQETEVRLREAEVLAPATCGTIGCLVETMSVRPGDLVPAGKPIVTLLEPSQLWIRIYVPEPNLGSVRVGQAATIKVDTFKDREFNGTVEQISSRAEFLPRNVQTREDRNHQVFGVKVRVDNTDGALKSGMAATVRMAEQLR